MVIIFYFPVDIFNVVKDSRFGLATGNTFPYIFFNIRET